MLIGTGTLAIAAASLTLTRAAAALPATGPEKRATDNPVLSLNITFVPEDLQGTLQPGNIVKVIGYVGKLKGRKSGANAWIGFNVTGGRGRKFSR